MKLCVIYEERTLFVRHIGFSVVKKKAAYHSAGSNVRDLLAMGSLIFSKS